MSFMWLPLEENELSKEVEDLKEAYEKDQQSKKGV